MTGRKCVDYRPILVHTYEYNIEWNRIREVSITRRTRRHNPLCTECNDLNNIGYAVLYAVLYSTDTIVYITQFKTIASAIGTYVAERE